MYKCSLRVIILVDSLHFSTLSPAVRVLTLIPLLYLELIVSLLRMDSVAVGNQLTYLPLDGTEDCQPFAAVDE